MSRLLKSTLLVVCCLFIAVPAYGQSQTFIVDDDGDPLTTYPDLATAVATAQSFPGGPHAIVIMPGAYSDANLSYTAGKIGDIGGDASAVPEDVVFTAPAPSDNFLAMQSDLYVHNMKIVGYAKALTGSALSNTTIEDVIVEGASGTGIEVNTWFGGMVDGFAFSNLDFGIKGTTWSNVTIQNGSFDNVGNAVDATDCDDGTFNVLTIADGNYGIVLRAGSHPNTMTTCTITGLANDGVWLYDANVDISGCNIEGNAWYAVRKAGTGTHWVMTVQDNCFSDNTGGTAQAYDDQGGTWTHNYYNDLAFPGATYTLDGGAVDSDPWRAENQPVGPTAVDVLGTVDVDFEWVLPDCDVTQNLAAYEFTVTWDAAKLAYVSAGYDEGYLGTTGDGALYTPIGGDPGTGSLIFAATNFSVPGEGNGRLAFAQFEAIDVGPVTITVASDYRDENNDPVSVNDPLDLDILISDNEAPVVVSMTPNNPIGDDTYSDFVDLRFSADATDNFCLYYFYYQLDGGSYVPAGAASGTSASVTDVLVDISALGEGAHTLSVYARDCAPGYLWSAPVDYVFTIDRTGPVLTSITLTDPDGCAIDVDFTNETTVDVTLVDDGTATQMEFWEGAWQGAVAYANPTSWAFLNTTDGGKTIWMRLYDAYGNMGNQVNDAITLDQTAPVMTGTLTLAGGAAKTKELLVSLGGVISFDGGIEFNASEDAGDLVCGDAGWASIPPPTWEFTLSGAGMKTVYFACRDEAGNISNVFSDDIEVDQTGPTVTDVVVTDPADEGAGGEDCTDTYLVDVTVSFDDADVVYVRFSNGGGAATVYGDGVTLMASPFTGTHTMTGGLASDQMVTIDVELEDDAKGPPGNTGSGSDDIYLDFLVPGLTSMTIVDAAATDAPLANANWTNDLTVNLELTGLTDDVIELILTEDNFVTADTVDVSADSPFPDPYVYSYTYQGTPTECAGTSIWVKTMDCSGNKTGAQTDLIWFDLTLPSFTDFSGPTITPSLAVTMSLTASDICNLWQMRISEDDPSFAGATWEAFNAAPVVNLLDKSPASNDGPRTLYAEVADAAGNIDAAVLEWTVEVDMTDPTGSMTVQQIPASNPYATAGYTNALTGLEAVGIAWDADAVEMQIATLNCLPLGGGSNSGFVPVATSYQPISLDGDCGEGAHTVRIRFKDGADNIGGWVPYTIIYDATPPAAPTTAHCMPNGSMHLTWSAVTEAQSYILRYNFTGEYPHYSTVNPPPHPMTMGEGLPMTEVAALEYDFEGPHPDIYAVSLWTRDLAGNVSTGPNTNAVGTNYILGDFYTSDPAGMGPDGCIDFVDEFGALANAYNSAPADPNWNEYLNIAPTSDGNPLSRPVPDMAIGFEDLIIFSLNYVHYRCGSGGTRALPVKPKIAPAAPVQITADIPSHFAAGEMVTIPVRIDNAAAIRGYHVVLDYNDDAFRLIGVSAGAAYESLDESFFYYDQGSKAIDVSGVVLDAEGAFTDGELFTVRLQANTDADVALRAGDLTFRDDRNTDITVDFEVHVIARAALPTSFALAQNYPNPFNAGTVIPVDLKQAADWTLTVYNVAGQVVKTFSGYDVGRVNVAWDGRADNGSSMSSGMYFYRLVTGDFIATKKMVLLK